MTNSLYVSRRNRIGYHGRTVSCIILIARAFNLICDLQEGAFRSLLNNAQAEYFDAKKLKQIDGIWIATETHVTKKKGKKTTHKTVLKLDNVEFQDAMDEGVFTVRRLEKGL
ncbi:MAG: outer membrane lipoprotein-sorting protein [Candidatus Electrothrix sp. MAN1_4]|nr:outer membrane lipoprotein-sorting protein [Candidatus Electrothrix sp. MAN1_4]